MSWGDGWMGMLTQLFAGRLPHTKTRWAFGTGDRGVENEGEGSSEHSSRVLLEDGSNVDGLLEQAVGEFDLVSDRATVDLDLHEVSLLLAETSLADLGVCEDTDDGAVLADTLELTGDGLATILSVLLGIAGEGLLL